MIVGAYTLDLYCDNLNIKDGKTEDEYHHQYDEFPCQFIFNTEQRCIRAARDKGWLFTRDGKAFCPKCSGKKRKEII